MTIPSNKAAIVSDLHFGVHQNGEKWLKEALKFAEWFKQEMLIAGITDIILPGDFFHDRTDINLLTLQYASEVLNLWSQFRIWMIPGNHDCYNKDNARISSVSILREHKAITLMDQTTTVYAQGKKIIFVPWGTEIKDIPQGDLIVGHFELNGFKMNSFKVCEGGDDTEQILDKAPLVVTGHFHLRQEKRGKKGTVLYVGTPYQMDYNDMGSDKGYHIINFDDMQIKFVVYEKTTKHVKVTLTDMVDNKNELTAYLDKWVRGNVVTFIVDKEVDFDKVNALTQKLLSFEPLAFRGVELTYKKNETDVQTEDVQVNIQIEQMIGDFINQLELENAEAVLKLVLELYTKYKVA